MNLKTLLFCSLLPLIISGCDATRENDPIEATSDSLQLALEQAIDHTIIPAVKSFNDEAVQLEQDANAFCAFPSVDALATLQTQWKALSNAWYKLNPYNFGPLNDDIIFPKINFIDSLRLRGTNYTETVRAQTLTLLENDQTLDLDYFRNLSFQKVGLLPLESLIFETSDSSHSIEPSAIINDYENASRKCDILIGLAELMTETAKYVRTGWTENHKNEGTSFRSIFLNAELEDGTEPLTKLIASMQEHLDYLQKRSVVLISGKISGNSWENITASIDSIEQLLSGTEETSANFFQLMESGGYQNAVATVRENIAEIRQNILNKDDSLLEISLGKFDGNFKREIPDGLDVTLGINFSDGD